MTNNDIFPLSIFLLVEIFVKKIWTSCDIGFASYVDTVRCGCFCFKECPAIVPYSYDWDLDCRPNNSGIWYMPQLCKSKSSVIVSIPDRQQQPASRPCRKHWLSIDIEAEIQVTRASEHRSHVVGKSGRNRAWEGRKRTGIQHIRLPGNSPETQSFWIFSNCLINGRLR